MKTRGSSTSSASGPEGRLSTSDRIGEEIRRAAAQVEAPQRLREAVAAGSPRARASRSRTLLLPAAALAAAALLAVSLAGLLGGGAGSGGEAARAVDAALAEPEAPARGEASIDGLTFPTAAYDGSLSQTGTREGRIAGRPSLTVVYGSGPQRVGYTIVSRPALAVPEDARRVERSGIRFAVLEDGDRSAVAWERDGRTCVLAASGVSVERLLDFLPS